MSDDDPVKTEALTSHQIKAARALLGWSRMQLGLRSNTSVNMVKSFEKSGRVASLNSRDRTVPVDAQAAIRATLEAAGIEFANGKVPAGSAAGTTPITPDQVRVARKLLRWSQRHLSDQSGTSFHVVQTFERTGRLAKLYGRTDQIDALAAIRAALEAAGAVFTNGDEPGVKLRKADQ